MGDLSPLLPQDPGVLYASLPLQTQESGRSELSSPPPPRGLVLSSSFHLSPGIPSPSSQEAGSPASTSLRPRNPGPQPPPFKDSRIWASIFIFLLLRPQNPSSRGTSCAARALPEPGSAAGAAHPRSPAAARATRGSRALCGPVSLDPQEDLAG